MEMVLRRMKIEEATVHGFRSSFRDWAGNVSSFPRELIETALAHVIGDRRIANELQVSGLSRSPALVENRNRTHGLQLSAASNTLAVPLLCQCI